MAVNTHHIHNISLSNFAQRVAVDSGNGVITFSANTLTLQKPDGNTISLSDEARFALSANNANNLGGVPASSYITTFSDYTINGELTFARNLIISNLVGIIANGVIGEAGQFLASNGTTVYWTAGPIGYTGSQGDIGYTGSQGVIGYTGSAGTTFLSGLSDVVVGTPANGDVLMYISDFDKYYVMPINNIQDTQLSNTVMDGGSF